MKGIEEKDIKNVTKIKDINKGIVKEIDKQKFVLESKFDIESLPKISEGIINKDIIQKVPDSLQKLIPGEFNFKELDEKFQILLSSYIYPKKKTYY